MGGGAQIFFSRVKFGVESEYGIRIAPKQVFRCLREIHIFQFFLRVAREREREGNREGGGEPNPKKTRFFLKHHHMSTCVKFWGLEWSRTFKNGIGVIFLRKLGYRQWFFFSTTDSDFFFHYRNDTVCFGSGAFASTVAFRWSDGRNPIFRRKSGDYGGLYQIL